MQFTTQTNRSFHQLKTAALFVGVFEEGQLGQVATAIDTTGDLKKILKKEFKAELGRTLVLRQVKGIQAERLVLVGLGKKDNYNPKALMKAHTSILDYLKQSSLTEGVSTLLEEEIILGATEAARLAVRAMGVADYQYTTTLSKPTPTFAVKKFAFTVSKDIEKEVKQGISEGQAIANGMNFTRQLGNLPANICTPTYLGEQAKSLAKEFARIKTQVLDKKQIEALKMGSFLSVAAGSDQPPRFIVMQYQGASKKQKPVVLVGKGVTFDTGGISLKPGLNMDEMKYDMCGAATVFGVMRTVAELDLKCNLVVLVPATENMPSGHATKPGDVVTSMSGQTIEVLNTDAEGRLILCDALTYAERFNPEAVIDVATLTGAIIISLGHIHTGVFANDDELAQELVAAGKRAYDTAWQMPLDEVYQERLKSNFADMANIGGSPGGSITAACFLSRFAKAYRWAHLDIAGTAWDSGASKGATGRPVSLLVDYLLGKY
ncbi:leucyl aminopeptidase [Pelistega europaea]|uniref:Probable cytosol aminopeptidase n=1 Tax=Pelistega europaea TaxID=106147 RepID=A0A7Y4LCM9_9BURK|nr:leucyl aminopeptidase [Pelistega europaea]NOL49811.1 leucyl aminopeptidase [Pelistega europaea]